MKRALVTSCLYGLLVVSALAAQEAVPEDPYSLFHEANTAYEEGRWDSAAGLFEELLERGFDRADVHYNLGNALLRQGELGRAIASYRRCLEIEPRHRDAQANLDFARRSNKDAIEPPAPSEVIKTLFFWHFSFGRQELLAATIALNLLLWLLLIALLFRRRSELLRWSAILVLLTTLAVAASTAVHHLFPTRVAVVLPQEVEARAGTRADAVVRFRLHAGAELRVVEQREDWIRIALPDGEQGWIEREHAEIV